MTNNSTTLEEILEKPFLKKRLDEIRQTIAIHPDSTALWIGAGHSASLSGLPTWRKFLLECLDSIDSSQKEHSIIKSIIEAGRLQLAAEYLYQLQGNEIFKNITQTYGKLVPSKKPAAISKFCASKIITTNYDSVIENSMRYYAIRTPLDPIESLMSSEFNLIKLHGTADKPESCVLTISSYAKTYNREFEWYLINTFLTNTVIFIGASMDKSEPFFKSIATIKKFNKDLRKHYAIVSIDSDEYGKYLGKELERMGIDLIPYVPDKDHSTLDKILDYLSTYTFTPAELNSRLNYLRGLTKQKRFCEVAVFLHNMCQDELNDDWNLEFGDVINNFFTELFNTADVNQHVDHLKKVRLNISNIVRTASNLKKIKRPVLEGLILAFQKLEKIDGENYEIDRRNISNRIRREFSREK
ncbi:MAG TPA: SIR2 family protein [Chryseolinea sp.]